MQLKQRPQGMPVCSMTVHSIQWLWMVSYLSRRD